MHFGSAPCFIVYDLASGETKVVRNHNAHHQHGHCNPVQALGHESVDAVLVAGIGHRALARLQAMGLKVYQAQRQTVRRNLEALQRGALPEFTMERACSGHHHDHGDEHDGLRTSSFPSVGPQPGR